MLPTILSVLGSPAFHAGLAGIDKNYFYIKQERNIRDLLAECINATSVTHQHKAFVENLRAGRLAADMALFDTQNTHLGNVGIKFQYPGDVSTLTGVRSHLVKDFAKQINGQSCRVFILVVQEITNIYEVPLGQFVGMMGRNPVALDHQSKHWKPAAINGWGDVDNLARSYGYFQQAYYSISVNSSNGCFDSDYHILVYAP